MTESDDPATEEVQRKVIRAEAMLERAFGPLRKVTSSEVRRLWWKTEEGPDDAA